MAPPKKFKCAIDGCGKPARSRVWCSAHYERWRRYGDPLLVHFNGRPFIDRFWLQVEKSDTCWLWRGSALSNGYGQIAHNRRHRLAHRVAWELAYGPIPDGLWVLHHCDTPRCVRPDHLFVGTHQDNNDDKVRKGRQARGETGGRAVLNTQQVRDAYRLRQEGLTYKAIAAIFGVDPTTIYAALRGPNWRHLRDELGVPAA
jgi:hypothetical protein